MFLKKGYISLFVISLLLGAFAQDSSNHDACGDLDVIPDDYDFYDTDDQPLELSDDFDPEFDPEFEYYPENPHNDEIRDILSDTIPGIPEGIINDIGQENPGLLEYIVQRHPNFKKLVLNMEPKTIDHFCRHVPSFGRRLRELNAPVLRYLRDICPTISRFFAPPRTKLIRKPSVKPTTSTTTTSTTTTTTPTPTTTQSLKNAAPGDAYLTHTFIIAHANVFAIRVTAVTVVDASVVVMEWQVNIPAEHRIRPIPIKREVIGIILDTMPDIPEELINEIGHVYPGLLEYIIERHSNFVKLVLYMEPGTIEHLCRCVPSFGKRLGTLNSGELLMIRKLHPKIDRCIVRPRRKTTRAPAVDSTKPETTRPTEKATTKATTVSTPTGTTTAKPSLIRRILDALGMEND
ncbi:hypothetical protein Aperf_G00000057396 [Anoplocephala perfoliata]